MAINGHSSKSVREPLYLEMLIVIVMYTSLEKVAIMDTLLSILDPSNRPLLVHCNKGKHRTGSIIGCLRKLRGWSLSSIFAEYLLFALPKSRLEDQMCIEEFNVDEFWAYAEANGHIDLKQLMDPPNLKNSMPLSSAEKTDED